VVQQFQALSSKPGHGGGRLQGEQGEVGRQHGSGFGLDAAAANDSAGAAGLGGFLLGGRVRVMEETILAAPLGMGLAVGSVVVLVAATARLRAGVGLHLQELGVFHQYPPWGTSEDHDGRNLWKFSQVISLLISLWRRAPRQAFPGGRPSRSL